MSDARFGLTLCLFALNRAHRTFVLFPHSAFSHPTHCTFTYTLTHPTKTPELPPSSQYYALIAGTAFWQVPAKRRQGFAWSKNMASWSAVLTRTATISAL